MANKYPSGSPDTWSDDELRLQLDQIEEARRNGTLSPRDEQMEEAIFKAMASKQFGAPPPNPNAPPPPPNTSGPAPSMAGGSSGGGGPQPGGSSGGQPSAGGSTQTSGATVGNPYNVLPPVTTPPPPVPPPPPPNTSGTPSPTPPPAPTSNTSKPKKDQEWKYDNSFSIRVPDMLPDFERGGGIGQGLGAQGSSVTVGNVGQAVGGMAEFAGRLGVPYAKEIGEVVQALSAVPDAVKDFIKGLHNANMEFAEFSGTMADVKANQQEREIDLAMQRGDRRAGSAAELAEAMHEMNREFARGEDVLANILNKMGADFAKWMTEIIRLLNALLPPEKDNTVDLGAGVNMREQIFNIQQDKDVNIGAWGRPPRFQRP